MAEGDLEIERKIYRKGKELVQEHNYSAKIKVEESKNMAEQNEQLENTFRLCKTYSLWHTIMHC